MHAVLLGVLVACQGSNETLPPPAPTPTPAASSPHAEHGGASNHMTQMASVRDGLRSTLGAAYDAPVEGLAAADSEKGRVLYGTHCAPCHGESGKGDGPQASALRPPPGDLTDAFHARYYSDAGRVHLIRSGIPGTAMPAYSGTLTDQEILDVYAYVQIFRGEAGAAEQPHDHPAGDH